MKRLKIYLAYVAVAALFMTSCSKEEGPDAPPGGEEMGVLSFNVLLKDYETSNKQSTKQAEEVEVPPSCDPEGNSDPFTVRAMIAVGNGDTGIYVDDGDANNGNAVDIRVIPVGNNDSDGDGMANWLTYEEDFLELTQGQYTLLYFEVLNDTGEVLYMAPNSNDNYGPYSFDNFVEDPLPHVIQVNAGEKPYNDVEVLCYDEVYAEEFGYLFFDFEMLPLQYICIFGNECTDEGRHYPSNFRIVVWEYPEGDLDQLEMLDREDAFVNATNEAVWQDGVVLQADPLCIPLPDREGQMFYAEVYTIDSQGNETLIRRGDFDAEDIDQLYDPETDTYNYWHFRHGEYCEEDSDPCLLSRVVTDWTQDFTGLINLPSGLYTDYIDVDTNDDGVYDGNDNPPATAPFGGYLITDNPQDYYSGFVSSETGDDGEMIVFDGSPDITDRVIYTIETPELCEGDIYYLKMRVKDISAPDVNNARLRVRYRSGNPESATTVGNFAIDPLINDGGGSAWATVGFVMVATEDGKMVIRIRDREDDNSGNDFAMDDIVLSNDPTTLFGVLNINPNN
ncbi:MAG: hypothetical protein WBL21_00620 [Salinimicrobium sp.]